MRASVFVKLVIRLLINTVECRKHSEDLPARIGGQDKVSRQPTAHWHRGESRCSDFKSSLAAIPFTMKEFITLVRIHHNLGDDWEGCTWAYGFLSRHSNEVSFSKPSTMDMKRVIKPTLEYLLGFLAKYKDLLDYKALKPEFILNVDESGAKPGPQHSNKSINAVGKARSSQATPDTELSGLYYRLSTLPVRLSCWPSSSKMLTPVTVQLASRFTLTKSHLPLVRHSQSSMSVLVVAISPLISGTNALLNWWNCSSPTSATCPPSSSSIDILRTCRWNPWPH